MKEEKPSLPPLEANAALLQAFAEMFVPVPNEAFADEVMDYARLREYFGAYYQDRKPDIFPLYINELTKMGYDFHVSWAGDLALFLKRKGKPVHTDPLPLPSPRGGSNYHCDS